jgi:hypothetical protein
MQNITLNDGAAAENVYLKSGNGSSLTSEMLFIL